MATTIMVAVARTMMTTKRTSYKTLAIAPVDRALEMATAKLIMCSPRYTLTDSEMRDHLPFLFTLVIATNFSTPFKIILATAEVVYPAHRLLQLKKSEQGSELAPLVAFRLKCVPM